MPVPVAVPIALAAIKGYGAIRNAQSQNASNRETRRQNRYMRKMTDEENAINREEYYQDRPLDHQGKRIDAEMKKLKYLEFLRSRGIV